MPVMNVKNIIPELISCNGIQQYQPVSLAYNCSIEIFTVSVLVLSGSGTLQAKC